MANKADLIKKVQGIVAEKTGEKVSIEGQGVNATVIVDSVVKAIEQLLLEDGKVAITGFGNFEVRERAERNGVNPATQEPMTIPATKVPAFKASSKLKELVKNN